MSARRPSWKQGFARSADESDAPEQWVGDVGSYAPFLGVQGNTLYDLSGFVKHGTLINMTLSTAWVMGERGYALAFDAVNDYVDCGVLTALSGATRASMVGWIYRGGTGDTVGFGQHRDPYRFSVLWYSDGNVYISTENGGLQSYPSFGKSEIGWHLLGVTYNGSLSGLSRLTAYWDGVPQTLITGGEDPPSSLASGVNQPAFWLGADNGVGVNRYWGGQIGDVRVYNRTLSATEMMAIYADPFARYRLRDEAGQVVTAEPLQYILSVESGGYAITGTDIGFKYDRNLVIESGAYTLSGSPIRLIYSGAPPGGYIPTYRPRRR